MTTRTSPTDNERLSRLEGIVEQIVARLDSMESRMDSLRNLFITLLFAGFGIMWATMVGGFIAILNAIANINA